MAKLTTTSPTNDDPDPALSDAFAARQIAEVNGVGLVGGQAVVAAFGVGGRDLLPCGALVGRRIRDRSAAGRCVVKPAETVGHDGRLAAVRPDVGDAIPRRGRGQDTGRQTDGNTYDRCDAQHRGDSTLKALHLSAPPIEIAGVLAGRNPQHELISSTNLPHRPWVRRHNASLNCSVVNHTPASVPAARPAHPYSCTKEISLWRAAGILHLQ